MPKSTAPRCWMSGHTQLITDPDHDTWETGEQTTCNVCKAVVRFRVRRIDMPPVARILPHRTDGTPTR